MTVQSTRIASLDTLHLTLDAPKGNILDRAMIAELTDAFEKASHDLSLKAIVIGGAGPDFCFGASVEEHLPGAVAAMLNRLHRLLVAMVEAPVPVLVAVQGRCLGGGLELALAGSRIFASPEAVLGQPEVKLGVFAPAASALLPERIGQAAAEDLLLTGRNLKGAEALTLGLVDELAVGTPPIDQALAWVGKYLITHSHSGLRFACRAARMHRAERLRHSLERLERLYLEELMITPDAIEGLSAFLQKRPAKWAGAHP